MLTRSERAPYLAPLTPIPSALEPSGSIETDIACVLFDIYGTLFVSGAGEIGPSALDTTAAAKIRRICEKHGIAAEADALMKELHARIDATHRRRKAQGVDYPEIEIDRIWMEILGRNDRDQVRKFAIEIEMSINPAYPMPHLEQLLEALTSRGILLGIVSNAQFFTPHLFDWFLGAFPEALGFDADLIFYSYRCGRAKPSGYLFERATAQLAAKGIAAGSVLYVGNDMRNDILPAQTAGLKTALFAGDRRSLRLRPDEPCCRGLTPDIIVTDLLQLLDHI